ncbi:MAG: hypothetical protein QNJ22_06680 [Desulfosarcinaceae bacterium]|nr:hypothetical protein [Desulfosarcinaceae bacterium]
MVAGKLTAVGVPILFLGQPETDDTDTDEARTNTAFGAVRHARARLAISVTPNAGFVSAGGVDDKPLAEGHFHEVADVVQHAGGGRQVADHFR